MKLKNLVGSKRRLGWNEVESQHQASPEIQNAGITLRFIPAFQVVLLYSVSWARPRCRWQKHHDATVALQRLGLGESIQLRADLAKILLVVFGLSVSEYGGLPSLRECGLLP